MVRRFLATAAALVALGALAACDPGQEASASAPWTSERLLITGSSTLAPLLADIARRYEAAHPDVRVDVQTGGSSRGIADATSGLAAIGMSSRDLTAHELAAGVGVTAIARDGVAFAVHRDNPVGELDERALRAIYTGAATRWSQVGGADAPITAIGRAEGRSELTLLREHLGLAVGDMEPTLIAGETQQALKLVAGDPNAIVYVSLGSALFEIERGAPVRLLPLAGVAASPDAVADGTFPLARPLLVVTAVEPTPLVRSFLEFARSAHVHDLVRAHAFVPPR